MQSVKIVSSRGFRTFEPCGIVTQPKPVGRLELTWTNKHLRLPAHEDGSYEWVEPSDRRVAGGRLLGEAGEAGDTSNSKPSNLLIRVMHCTPSSA